MDFETFDAAYQPGWLAGYDNNAQAVNPYPAGSLDHKIWFRGFDDGAWYCRQTAREVAAHDAR